MRRTALALTLALAALGCGALTPGCRSAEAAREHERVGAQLLQQGRTAEGVAALEAALEEDPGSVQAAISLAAIYERAGDPTRALRILTDVVQERPTTGLPRMSLAALLTRLGRMEEALGHYALVGQISRHAPAYLGMADIYETRGETAAAERAIIAAIQAEPTNPSPRLRLAQLYDGIGRPEARVAWERYLAAATGNPDERPSIDEANARLRILAPALSPEEQAAILATVRRHLATIPLGPGGSLSPTEVAAVAADAGPAPLRRFYSGRMHLRLRSPGAPIVRGVGAGASLYEGAIAAAEDLRRSRVYDLYYAGALGRARAEVLLEIGDPEPFAIAELAPEADVVPAEGGPFDEDDLLEWRLGPTTVVVLPTDRAAHGLPTLRATLAWAATEAGAPGEWRKGALRRVRVRGFIEDEAGGWAAAGARPAGAGEGAGAGGPVTAALGARAAASGGANAAVAAPVDLEGGLPAPPPVDRMSALAAARAGALWMVGLIGAEGAIPSAYDPGTGALAPPSARSQSAAVEALLQAAQSTGEARLRDGASLARRWLAIEILRTGGAGPTASAGPTATAGPAPAGEALPLAAAIERAIVELDAPASVSGTSLSGAELAAARTAAERRLAEVVREALRLSIDPCASLLYTDRRRPLLGAFREGRLDPRVTLEGTARLVAALCRAAPRLRSDASAPSKS